MYSQSLVLKAFDDLKTLLGKTIRCERGLSDLSENLSEIDLRYNNVIVLDDLMADDCL